jgi:hypothetical protein
VINPKNLRHTCREICLPLLVSFETGEQVTDLRIYPPDASDWRLVGVRYEVVKALANTDVGLIDLEAVNGDDAITQISLPHSSALGTRGSAVLAAASLPRMRAGAGQGNAYWTLTSAKATAGGKVMVFLYFRTIQPGSEQE